MQQLNEAQNIISSIYNINTCYIFNIDNDEVCILNVPDDFLESLYINIVKILVKFYKEKIINKECLILCKMDIQKLFKESEENDDFIYLFTGFKNVLNNYFTEKLKYTDKYLYNVITNELYYVAYPIIFDDYILPDINPIFTFKLEPYNWIKVKKNFYNQ